MFKKMPWLLAGIIGLVVLIEPYLPMEVKSGLYALSLTIKSLIIFILPLIIFSLLFKTTVQLAHHATKIILLIVAMICLSNFSAAWLSHYMGILIYDQNLSVNLPHNTEALLPLWSFSLPSWIPNEKALILGGLLGIGLSFLKPQLADTIADQLSVVVDKLLKIIIIIIPFFITGFIIKLSTEGNLSFIIEEYALIFALILVAQFAYIITLYGIANRFNLSAWRQSIKNMLPAAMAGFSTMSSATAMPLTLIGTQKNSQTSVGTAVIPVSVNVHLIGDCFAIPILAYAILKNYGIAEPSLIEYFTFAVFFVIAKFSVAAVPGGGILVMLPILENHLGFNAPMLSLITALYILFDPVITTANVLGNGAFAMIIDKIQVLFNRKVIKTA